VRYTHKIDNMLSLSIPLQEAVNNGKAHIGALKCSIKYRCNHGIVLELLFFVVVNDMLHGR
jgi:hypothetical protein